MRKKLQTQELDGNVPAITEKVIPTEILEGIRKRFAHRQPLNITAVKRECPELIEPLYLPHAFVGWRKALESARIPFSKINVELTDVVECRLCGKEFGCLGSHLLLAHEYTTDDYLAEFPRAEICSERILARRFGIFIRGRESRRARLRMPHWEPFWSREYALDRLFYFHECGHPIYRYALWKLDPTLAGHLGRLFTSYDDALAAIGLNPLQVRQVIHHTNWSREKILEELHNRLATGKSLSLSVVEKDIPNLTAAATRYFGSYRAAVEMLGIDYERKVKRSRQRAMPELRREILEAARHLAAMPEYDWNAVAEFQKKYRGALQPHFRNWNGVALHAGIPVERITFGAAHLLDRETVLECLRQRHSSGLSLRSADVARDDHRLSFSVFKHFGRLTEALKKAGIAVDLPRGHSRRYEDPQAIIDAIRERKAAGKSLGSASLLAGNLKDQPLYYRARRFFGSWRDAILAAGLNPMDECEVISTRERYPTSDDVLKAIRERKKEGKSLRWADACLGRELGGNRTLILVAQDRFGSWHAALATAGFDPHRESPLKGRKYGSKALVIEEVRRRHREGLTLDPHTVRYGRVPAGGDLPLYKSAKRFFGNWKRVVSVALGSQ